jgi:hypothetical protein
MKLPKAPFFTDMMKRGEPQLESISGKVVINISEQLEAELGWTGKMLSASKSDYRRRYPDHEVFFNACIFTEDGTQVWFGDLDLTLDNAKLQAAATAIGQELYVTPEQPYRFVGLKEGVKQAGSGATPYWIYHPKEADHV